MLLIGGGVLTGLKQTKQYGNSTHKYKVGMKKLCLKQTKQYGNSKSIHSANSTL